MRASGSASQACSHTDMELFTGGTADSAAQAVQLGFLSYSNIRTQPLAAPTLPSGTVMEPLRVESSAANADSVVAINGDIRDNGGALPESPGLGVSGANPRLVNGEAVSNVGLVNGEKATVDVQRLSAAAGQSVLKKVLSVSEAEGLLLAQAASSAEAEIERGVVNGSGGVIDTTPDSQSKVC